MKRAAVLWFLSLAACAPTVQDVRDQPARFDVHVPGNMMDVGACLATMYSTEEELDVSYFPLKSAKRTEVVGSTPSVLLVQKQPMVLFELSVASPEGTRVVFRRRTLALGMDRIEHLARERVERCGKA